MDKDKEIWHRWSDSRNVVDRYKTWKHDDIINDLQENSHPFSVMMEHWNGDFNIGTLIRNANVFNAHEVFYCGKKKYDRRGCVGTHHYVNLQHVSDASSTLKELKQRYTFVCLDNVHDAIPIETFVWPENSLMIFGEEGIGISSKMLDMADHVVSITQYGSVRSMNVGTASGIAMYDFVKKHYKK